MRVTIKMEWGNANHLIIEIKGLLLSTNLLTKKKGVWEKGKVCGMHTPPLGITCTCLSLSHVLSYYRTSAHTPQVIF